MLRKMIDILKAVLGMALLFNAALALLWLLFERESNRSEIADLKTQLQYCRAAEESALTWETKHVRCTRDLREILRQLGLDNYARFGTNK